MQSLNFIPLGHLPVLYIFPQESHYCQAEAKKYPGGKNASQETK